MWDVTAPWANFLFDASNVLLVIGALAVLIGTFGSFKMGAAKEAFADERVSENERATSEANERAGIANANAGKANERAAQLEKEAAALRLELAKMKTPRGLSKEQAGRIAEQMRPFAGTLFDVAVPQGDVEAADLAFQIEDALRAAGLKQVDWSGGVIVQTRPNKPVLGTITRRGVVICVPTQAGTNLPVAALLDSGSALGLALTAEGIAGTMEIGLIQNNKSNAIHVLIGTKP